MFFMCRRGFNMRTMGRCGCRRVKDHEEHQSVVGTDSPPFDRHHT
jgi:hypothetical protein